VCIVDYTCQQCRCHLIIIVSKTQYCAVPLQLLLPPLLQDPKNLHICSKSMQRICNCTSRIYLTNALYKICCIIMHDFLHRGEPRNILLIDNDLHFQRMGSVLYIRVFHCFLDLAGIESVVELAGFRFISLMDVDWCLAKKMDRLAITPNTSSITDAFLQNEMTRNNRTKAFTRIELARAKNRVAREKNNVDQIKKRMEKLVDSMREHEAAMNGAKADVARLRSLLAEDKRNPDFAR